MIAQKKQKKWWGLKDEWGRRQGTGEAEIVAVRLFDKSDNPVHLLDPGDILKVEVDFVVVERIEEPHFGIAIFRDDGVYCYGPNTAFDGCKINSLNIGKGRFGIEYRNLLLSPGQYYLSVAIWDKKELFPYSYHPAFYDIKIAGKNIDGRLLFLSSRWITKAESTESILGEDVIDLDLTFLEDKFKKCLASDTIKISEVLLLKKDGREARQFRTREALMVKITLSNRLEWEGAGYFLWVGIYRNDRVYCHGSVKELSKRDEVIYLNYPDLPLLKGNYLISVGIWEKGQIVPVVCHHGLYPFEMITPRQDHGTVYIEHNWKWSLP